jgi:hypothetical protein
MARVALLMVSEILTAATAKKIVERILMTISLVFLVIFEHNQFILTGEVTNGFSRAGLFYSRCTDRLSNTEQGGAGAVVQPKTPED